MKSLVKKLGEVTLSVLLVGLICIPLPAMNAFAEEANGETIEQSQQVQSQAAETAAVVDDANADVMKSDNSDSNTMTSATNADEATEVNEELNTLDTMAIDTDQDSDNTDSSVDEAMASNAFTVSNAEELRSAFSTISADSAADSYTVSLAGDIDLSENIVAPKDKTVTIEGNGHKIVLEGSAALEVDSAKSILTLNGGLTIEASASHAGTMVVVQQGTFNMNTGVTIEGNNNNSAVDGGGVSVTDNGTFNMNGGTIENCAAHTGGGVYLCGATFNMSGDSVIQNCKTNVYGTLINGDGGGVFLNHNKKPGSTKMTISGNATVRNNEAFSLGGGVFVEVGTILDMEGNSSIVNNSARVGGGVMNYGLAKMTTLYNNSSIDGGDDLTSLGRIVIAPVNHDWVLASTGTHVTGWYYDTYRSYTDDSGNQAVDYHRWTAGDDDNNVEYIPTAGVTSEHLSLKAGAPLPETSSEPVSENPSGQEPEASHINVVWENEDGTILYKLENVKSDDIPSADEYVTLSGNDDPTEADTADGYTHEFEGWTETRPNDDEVLYIANYNLIPPDDTHADTPTTHNVDDNGNKPTPEPTEVVEEGGDNVPSTHVDSDDSHGGNPVPHVNDDDLHEGDFVSPVDGDESDTNGTTSTGADSDSEDAVVQKDAVNSPTETTDDYGSLPKTGDGMEGMLVTFGSLMGISVLAFGASRMTRRSK